MINLMNISGDVGLLETLAFREFLLVISFSFEVFGIPIGTKIPGFRIVFDGLN